MDVTSLYTSIPHSDGLIAVKHFLRLSSYKINATTILRLTELVLTLNSFQFGDDHYHQTRGVAMGTRMGPSYTCLFMGHIEEQIFSRYPGPLPDLFKRFIDDCFGVSTLPKTELQDFIQYVSNFHPSLKFTHVISETSLPFLDINVILQPGFNTISTSVHYKPTDSHSYLLFSSSHPKATKESIPFSQFLRLRRLCSQDEDFIKKTKDMSQFFMARGYPLTLIQQELERAMSVPRSQALNPKDETETDDRSIFTLTYHPHNIPVRNILRRNFSLLQEDPDLKDTFKKPPLAAFKRDKNLGDHLIRSVYHPVPRRLPPGNSKCHKPGCKTCPFICTFTIFQGPSGQQFEIKSHFTCQSTDLVYILSCSLCHKMYVGETYRTLNERFKEHRNSIITGKDTPIGIHFNSGIHSLSHVRVAAVWRNGSDDWLYRKFIESRVISRLGTLQPHGLNTKE